MLQFAEKTRIAARHTLNGYIHFIPGILTTWVGTEILAAATSQPAIAGYFLFWLGYVTVAAGAAKAMGLHQEQSAWWLGISRTSIFLDYFVLAMLAFLLLLPIIGIALTFQTQMTDQDYWILGWIWAGVVMLMLSRYWPVLAIGFLYQGTFRWSPSGGGSMWHGPGLGKAWRLTASRGVLSGTSLPLLMVIAVIVGGWLGLRQFTTGGGWTFLLNLLFYAVALPWIASLAFACAEPLVERDGEDARGV